MSIHAMAWAKATTHAPDGSRLTPAAKLVLLVIADYINAESGTAWASMPRIARESQLSERWARKTIAQLEELGLLLVERRRQDDGQNLTNVYRLPAMQPTAALTTHTPAHDGPVKAADLREALVGDDGILDGFLVDYPDSPAQAYLAALDAADVLAAENAGVSKDTQGYLRNAVVAHAAQTYAEIDGKPLARLNREAKALGVDGHRWLVRALLHTASANVEGDLCSYAIAAARRMKSETAA